MKLISAKMALKWHLVEPIRKFFHRCPFKALLPPRAPPVRMKPIRTEDSFAELPCNHNNNKKEPLK